MKSIIIILGCWLSLNLNANAQESTTNQMLNPQQKSIISIAALTAKGDLIKLKPALNSGLDAGLTISEIKEALIQLYAYCGFPRSIRGLQTFMEVLNERKSKGVIDKAGSEATPISEQRNKYEHGKAVLAALTKTQQDDKLSGYSAFAPTIDRFLKEHLFADIFERDVLTYAQREWVTISVLSAIGGLEPMLQSHLYISLNVGITPNQLEQFVETIGTTVGEESADATQKVLNEVLKNKK